MEVQLTKEVVTTRHNIIWKRLIEIEEVRLPWACGKFCTLAGSYLPQSFQY